MSISADQSQNPIIGWSGLAVALLVVLTAGSLFYLNTRSAELKATQMAPSSLSALYLRLSLESHPRDASLRLKTARAYKSIGRLEEALVLLKPLINVNSHHRATAQLLQVEIGFLQWTATAPEGAEHKAKLERLQADITSIDFTRLSIKDCEALVALSRKTGLIELAGEINAHLALRGGPNWETYLQEADRAFLEVGRAKDSAALYAEVIGPNVEARYQHHVFTALDRLNSSEGAAAAFALAQTLLARFPNNRQLLKTTIFLAGQSENPQAAAELGRRLLQVETGNDTLLTEQIQRELAIGEPDRALELALTLVRKNPYDKTWHRLVGKLARWCNRQLLAMQSFAWLANNDSGAYAPIALKLAKAEWDLPLLARLTENELLKKPPQPEDWIGLAALHEAVGDGEKAEEVIEEALQGEMANNAELWNFFSSLLLRLGHLSKAVAVLTATRERFGETAMGDAYHSYLLILLGRNREALELLNESSDSDSYSHQLQIATLAYSFDQIPLAIDAHEKLVRHALATPGDLERLVFVKQRLGEHRSAARIAEEGWKRDAEPGFLRHALFSALAIGDTDLLGVLVRKAEDAGPEFTSDAKYWRLRISLRQNLAGRAFKNGELRSASRLLSFAEKDLRTARRKAPRARRVYEKLWQAQASQSLHLALATGNKRRLSRLYETHHHRLNPLQRASILYKLGRDDEVEVELRDALDDPGLSTEQRIAASADLNEMARKDPRFAWTKADFSTLGNLRTWHGEVGILLGRREWHLGGAFNFWELMTEDGDPYQIEDPDEMAFQINGGIQNRVHRFDVMLGVDTRNMQNTIPFGAVNERVDLGESQLNARIGVNEVAGDTPGLRVLGVRDQLLLGTNIRFKDRFHVSASAATEIYSMRNRDILGHGLTINAATGLLFGVPPGIENGNVRIATYIARRYASGTSPRDADFEAEGTEAEGDINRLLAENNTWLGLAFTLGRGQAYTPLPVGKRFNYLLDGGLGWQWPLNRLGYFGTAGVGVSLTGRDLLSLSCRTSNTLETKPGTMTFQAGLQYAQGLWR